MRAPKVFWIIVLTKEQKTKMKRLTMILLIVCFISLKSTPVYANPVAPIMSGGAAAGASVLAFTPAAPVILIGAVIVGTGAAVYYLLETDKENQIAIEKEKEEKAKEVAEEIIKNGKPPNNKGGQIFQNREKKLPEGISYKEYDVNPSKNNGKSRDVERVVIGSDGSVWYTGDHYNSFVRLK